MRTVNRERFLQEAEQYVGYQAPASQPDMFSIAIGQAGIPWNGVFIDVCAKKAGIQLCSHVSTSAALANFVRTGKLYTRPRPGDIAFFEFPSEANFAQPHVGIVTDVEAWDRHGMFQCIEAQVNSGMPRASAAPNGVFKRARYKYELIGFGRPNFERSTYEVTKDPDPGKLLTKPVVKYSIFRPGLKHLQVVVVQQALSAVNGLKGVPRGEWDHKTRSSFTNFQRSIGYTGPAATGIPDENSLRHLAHQTKMFTVSE